MKTLYLDCGMGAAGDMLMAALYELCPDKEGFLKKMNGMGLPEVAVEAEAAEKCGIMGTHMKVTVGGEEEESVDEHGRRGSHPADSRTGRRRTQRSRSADPGRGGSCRRPPR